MSSNLFSFKHQDTTTTTTKRTTQSETTKTTHHEHTTKTTTRWQPPQTTTVLATAAPSDPDKSSATVIGVTVGVILVCILIAVSIVTIRKRNIKIPGMDAVRGLINPGYNRFDTGMVSLKELSSRDHTT